MGYSKLPKYECVGYICWNRWCKALEFDEIIHLGLDMSEWLDISNGGQLYPA
jgi:hypothetical protein